MLNDIYNDEKEFQSQLAAARAHEYSLWLESSITIDLLNFLREIEKRYLEETRAALCVTPQNIEKAIRTAAKSQSIKEILEYVNKTK